MIPAATLAELQLIERVYDDVEHGRLDAAVAKMREHYAEANAPKGPDGEVVTLQQAIENLWCICREANAVAVTLPSPVKGFQGWRRRWWQREIEIPFPDWKTRSVP